MGEVVGGVYDSYEEWRTHYELLNGIIGKTFAEELRPRNFEWFNQFKQDHPKQLVMSHFNTKGRRPAFERDPYFAGHWAYRPGTHVTISAGPTETVVHVSDASVFSMSFSNSDPTPDHIVIAPQDTGGPDWSSAEHTLLVGVDYEANTITVERGQFGSQPIDVPVGAHIAPHSKTRQEPVWTYNFSTVCPKDENGRDCAAVLFDEISGWFASDGPLSLFDGVEFDAMVFYYRGVIDMDNDGTADQGFVNGLNSYGIGLTEFLASVRSELPDKLFMADSRFLQPVYTRSFDTLNGSTQEGFPATNDPNITRWSDGLNMQRFWSSRGPEPGLQTILFKYGRGENVPGVDPDAYKRFRLVVAAAVFTDATFIQGGRNQPPPTLLNGTDHEVRVFDELWLGVEQQKNWLGLPVSPAVHLAAETDDLLAGGGVSWRDEFVSGLSGEGASFTREEGNGAPPRVQVTLSGTVQATSPYGTGAPIRTISLGQVDLAGPDLYLEVEVSADPLANYPEEIARWIELRALRESGEPPLRRRMWADQEVFTGTFYFRNAGPGTVDLTLAIEGNEPLTLHSVRAHAHPDAMYREFEHGLVLANPSGGDYTFDVGAISPGQGYRRIQGSAAQDPETNNGQLLGETVTVGPVDALVVVKTC